VASWLLCAAFSSAPPYRTTFATGQWGHVVVSLSWPLLASGLCRSHRIKQTFLQIPGPACCDCKKEAIPSDPLLLYHVTRPTLSARAARRSAQKSASPESLGISGAGPIFDPVSDFYEWWYKYLACGKLGSPRTLQVCNANHSPIFRVLSPISSTREYDREWY
jgi:hypothetical protein